MSSGWRTDVLHVRVFGNARQFEDDLSKACDMAQWGGGEIIDIKHAIACDDDGDVVYSAIIIYREPKAEDNEVTE